MEEKSDRCETYRSNRTPFPTRTTPSISLATTYIYSSFLVADFFFFSFFNAAASSLSKEKSLWWIQDPSVCIWWRRKANRPSIACCHIDREPHHQCSIIKQHLSIEQSRRIFFSSLCVCVIRSNFRSCEQWFNFSSWRSFVPVTGWNVSSLFFIFLSEKDEGSVDYYQVLWEKFKILCLELKINSAEGIFFLIFLV